MTQALLSRSCNACVVAMPPAWMVHTGVQIGRIATGAPCAYADIRLHASDTLYLSMAVIDSMAWCRHTKRVGIHERKTAYTKNACVAKIPLFRILRGVGAFFDGGAITILRSSKVDFL